MFRRKDDGAVGIAGERGDLERGDLDLGDREIVRVLDLDLESDRTDRDERRTNDLDLERIRSGGGRGDLERYRPVGRSLGPLETDRRR